MLVLLLYPLLTAALFYLGSRAKITGWLWRRYPPAIASFMDCAACVGFWHGFLVECTFGRVKDLLNIEAAEPLAVLNAAIVTGLCTLVLTPIVAFHMDAALLGLGTIAPGASDE